MPFFPFLPLAHGLLPVGLLPLLNGLSLLLGFIACPVAGTLGFHVGYCGFVKYLYGSPVYGNLQFFFAKGVARLVKVGNVELVVYSEFVPYHFLSGTVYGVLLFQQFGYLRDFCLRKFVSSHLLVCLLQLQFYHLVNLCWNFAER